MCPEVWAQLQWHHCSVVNRMASNLEGLIAAAASSDEEVMHVVAMVSAHLENFSLGEECVKQQISPGNPKISHNRYVNTGSFENLNLKFANIEV